MRNVDEMEAFSSPAARQDSSYRIPIRPLRLTSPNISSDKEDRSDKWQIKPPIVTAGRLSAVKLQDASSVQELKQEQWQASLQESQSQENAPLFEVNVMGADQQWYTITAKVGRTTGETGQVTPRPTTESLLSVPRASWSRPVSIDKLTFDQEDDLSFVPIDPPSPEQKNDDDTKKNFLLQVIQPGLTGLMDGSVSTLAPIFAVAFATQRPFTTFLVGMASALGAGISMAFSEALSDDGELTGRGKPLARGAITGLMTFLSGAGHALPFLIENIQLALFLAYAVVAVELIGIAAIRHKYFGTKWWLSIVQVVGGGLLVFIAALLLGNA